MSKNIMMIAPAALLFFFVFNVLFLRPAYPKLWDAVKKGDKREDVINRFSNLDSSLFEHKGYDFILKLNEFPFLASGSWQLILFYDQNQIVRQISLKYVNRNFGFSNKNIIK